MTLRAKLLAGYLVFAMATAYASIELAVDAMKLGATDFVRKPMTPEILRGAMAATLSRPETRKTMTRVTSATGQTSAHERSLIQTITLNGFEIIYLTEEQSALPLELDEHRFIVKSPDGKEREVIVKVDEEEAVGYVERMTRRRLPPSSSFWAIRAERFLSDYLWNEGKPPVKGRLTLTGIACDELI